MKSRPFSLLGVILWFSAFTAAAQEKQTTPPPPPPPANPEGAQPAPPRPVASPELPPAIRQGIQDHRNAPGFGGEASTDRRIAAFVRLKEMLFDTLRFDETRKTRFSTMFDDYFAGMLSGKYRPHSQPLAENMANPQDLPELKKQLEAAEKEGNKEKIETLKAKIYAANIVLEPHIVDEPIFFFNYLAAELTPEEREKFRPVLDRWRLLRVAEIAPDNDFKHLLRASRDPMLGFSEEKVTELRTMLLEAMRTVPFPQRNDQKIMTELAEKTKPKVLEQLNDKQKAHFEETIKMLAKWQKDDVEVAAKTRERLKNYVPSSQASNPADNSARKETTPAKP